MGELRATEQFCSGLGDFLEVRRMNSKNFGPMALNWIGLALSRSISSHVRFFSRRNI